MTDDLIGLMVSKIQTFSSASQAALKLAACRSDSVRVLHLELD